MELFEICKSVVLFFVATLIIQENTVRQGNKEEAGINRESWNNTNQNETENRKCKYKGINKEIVFY